MDRKPPIQLTPDWTGRLLILKPSSLGDIVHALPVLSALRRACPQAHIAWMVRPELAGLLECVWGIDEILLFDRRTMGRWFTPAGISSLHAFIKKLRRGRYDLALDLQGLLRSALFARAAGCRVRIGLAEAREGAVFFYTHTAEAPSSPHIVDYYTEVLKQLGVPIEPICFGLRPTQAARADLHSLLQKEWSDPGQFAVLIPGSAHARKCWPPQRFAQLAESLHQQTGLRIVAAGSQKEAAAITQIAKMTNTPILNLAGRTTLPQLTALFEKATLVIGNDTGPSHIAAAMDIPTVVIFGPTNPARLGPYQKPDGVAAVEPFNRGRAIDSPDPRYTIENVSLEMVLEKTKALLPRLFP